MAHVETVIESGGVSLRAHLARPIGEPTGPKPGLVLCHGFPPGPLGAAGSSQSFPQLADRLATESGWTVLTFNFRGTGESGGDFSLGGWLADVHAAIEQLLQVPEVGAVWVAGFSTGGALALCAAGEDERVRGAAALGSPADFEHWGSDPAQLVRRARELGVIRTKGFPEDLHVWSRDLREIRPLALIGKIPPRPVLLVHGSEDEEVGIVDARALADAADGHVELRVVTGAGHALRDDPRAVAVLLGWLDRQEL